MSFLGQVAENIDVLQCLGMLEDTRVLPYRSGIQFDALWRHYNIKLLKTVNKTNLMAHVYFPHGFPGFSTGSNCTRTQAVRHNTEIERRAQNNHRH